MSAQAALVLTVVSGAVGAAASIQAGRSAQAAADFQAEEAKRQGEQTKIRALDDELNRRRELAQTLGEQAAMGAQSGFDPFSQGSSFLALREETEREASRDLSAIRLLGANALRTSQLTADQARLAGRSALNQGYLQAGATLVGTGGKYLAARKTPASGFTGSAVHSGGTR